MNSNEMIRLELVDLKKNNNESEITDVKSRIFYITDCGLPPYLIEHVFGVNFEVKFISLQIARNVYNKVLSYLPDIIVIEFDKLNIDILTLINKLKNKPLTRQMQIIGLHDNQLLGDAVATNVLGFDELILKPVEMSTLIDRIRCKISSQNKASVVNSF